MIAMKNLVILSVLLNLACSVMAHATFGVRDVDHMKEHLQGTVDLDNLSDKDMLVHYFRVHDVEGNNKLDGCELLQSVLHFHSETSMTVGAPMKVFTDLELATMVDSVLDSDDKNMDGFIDYGEFLSGQISKGL
jgi:hypothetical protein